MTAAPRPAPDRLLTDPARLAIMSVLCSVDWCDFAFLRGSVGLSETALSRHLDALNGSAYQRRERLGRSPRISVHATDAGRDRFHHHVEGLHELAEHTPPASS
ncbi:hypothetical protein GCM10022222_83070 [Amycolatopsis ultiminotia]|uniref:Winged helix DNA-binding domain-containing protein n=1 Tax=Amycolatopsis ultiminotia TaxID=543629 RepID=A0ABP6YL12_9PSEU